VTIIKHHPSNKSKGCGFVKYRYREDAADAFSGLKNAHKKWVIEWATSSNDPELLGVAPNLVYVGGLPTEFTSESVLRPHFSKYGSIYDISIVHPSAASSSFSKYFSPPSPSSSLSAPTNGNTIGEGQEALVMMTMMAQQQQHAASLITSIDLSQASSSSPSSISSPNSTSNSTTTSTASSLSATSTNNILSTPRSVSPPPHSPTYASLSTNASFSSIEQQSPNCSSALDGVSTSNINAKQVTSAIDSQDYTTPSGQPTTSSTHTSTGSQTFSDSQTGAHQSTSSEKDSSLDASASPSLLNHGSTLQSSQEQPSKVSLTSYAFITYSEPSAAAAAIENENGTSFLGSVIRVQYCETPDMKMRKKIAKLHTAFPHQSGAAYVADPTQAAYGGAHLYAPYPAFFPNGSAALPHSTSPHLSGASSSIVVPTTNGAITYYPGSSVSLSPTSTTSPSTQQAADASGWYFHMPPLQISIPTNGNNSNASAVQQQQDRSNADVLPSPISIPLGFHPFSPSPTFVPLGFAQSGQLSPLASPIGIPANFAAALQQHHSHSQTHQQQQQQQQQQTQQS